MEVCEQNEAFVFSEEDGDLTFHHTKIILRSSHHHQYFYALSPQRYPSTTSIDPASLDLHPIPTSQIHPLFPETYTRAPQPLPENCYVKRPSLLTYGDTDASTEELSTLILDEAKACEILRVHPHPNIAQYLGCVVDGGRITGLCFVKYGETLLERVSKVVGVDGFNADLCLRGIRDGIQHLHKLGLVHCDINPANILMSGDGDNPIIIDFDSCRREGEHLGVKAGTRGWTREEFKFATTEIDEYGLSMIKDFLCSMKKPRKVV
ncbi:hypothetical protein V501_07700 [Pseudogymnoascus sp. VKM F-4519 (FW-2642)]|nr:hypothetical protein V501_07700 [Pseudogymnoascus sp. VKM F-4519 (FW-2642)]